LKLELQYLQSYDGLLEISGQILKKAIIALQILQLKLQAARGMSPKKDCLVFHSIRNFRKMLQNCGTREEIVKSGRLSGDA